ncbi:Arc family DNA-binding protein [Trinickia dinghuensis]|uniref:Arc family DNA-binding protein n=1 Tax=Trinickia dinghuensis TaxID=2291023 RepID=A0A3D8K181_9BURK|nr:Arc family DNA-binding protein [Trinickia dinghuensis]RDU99193.1 Arc family DNA-binding protein [Trinickia dinghuensis]
MKAEVKMQVRLPTEIRDALARDAKNNERSMNGQIIAILKEHLRAVGLTRDQQQTTPSHRE